MIHDATILPDELNAMMKRLLPNAAGDYFAFPFRHVITQGGPYMVDGFRMDLEAGDEFESTTPISIKKMG